MCLSRCAVIFAQYFSNCFSVWPRIAVISNRTIDGTWLLSDALIHTNTCRCNVQVSIYTRFCMRWSKSLPFILPWHQPCDAVRYAHDWPNSILYTIYRFVCRGCTAQQLICSQAILHIVCLIGKLLVFIISLGHLQANFLDYLCICHLLVCSGILVEFAGF